MTHDQLVNRAGSWLHARCGFVIKDYHSFAAEFPDALGFRKNTSILVECKVSRNDFRQDQKKERRHVTKCLGTYRYYMTPAGLLKPEEVPEGWGLLVVRGRSVLELKRAPKHEEPEVKVAEYAILYSLLRRAELRGYVAALQSR